jgi:putative membrane protein
VMGNDYAGGGDAGMWAVGGLMIVGVLILGAAVVWAVTAATHRGNRGLTAAAATPEAGGRGRTRQVLDERYARGEMNSEEYTERLHALGL